MPKGFPIGFEMAEKNLNKQTDRQTDIFAFLTLVLLTPSQNGSDAYISYTREFMVRYNNNFITSVDQKVTAECRVSEGGSRIYSHGAATINKTGE